MRRVLKRLCVLLGLAILLSTGFILYETKLKTTMVYTDVSDDGLYKLTVAMIGDPQFPYGPAYCRVQLKQDRSRVSKINIEVCNDGGPASTDNFQTSWGKTYVELMVSSQEKETEVYRIFFDGAVEEVSET